MTEQLNWTELNSESESNFYKINTINCFLFVQVVFL